MTIITLGGYAVNANKSTLNKPARVALWLLLDAALVNIAMILSQVLRYSFNLSAFSFFSIYWRSVPAITLICLVVFWAFGFYRCLWQYASAEDLLRIALATLVSTLLCYVFALAANLFVKPLNLFRLHRMVYPLFWVMSMVLVGCSRFVYRVAVTKEFSLVHRRSRHGAHRTMIIGAGWAGASLVHEMQRGRYGNSVPVVVVDDDRTRAGSRISGVPVARGSGNILKLASDYHVDDIIIAIATPHGDLTQLIEKCLATGCRVKRVNPLQDVAGEPNGLATVRDLDISDLLGRPEERLDMTQVAAFFRDKTVLITGGGGSIGSELCRRLLPFLPEKIVLYDVSENYMYDLFAELRLQYQDDLGKRLELCVGSIRDAERLDEVMAKYQPDIVLHAAAHKHVPLMEDCPDQAVKNNVFGTYLTAQAAIRHHVKRFVLISTDKAVNPTNVMGATKRLAEIIVEALNSTSDTEFTAVRFGNVLGSHGSVVPLFERQIRAGGPVTLTHPDIIRYFMTIPEAASLVLQTASIARGGELFVLDMGQPVSIRELAEQMIQLYSENGKKVDIVYTGLRKGEKLYEELLLAGEGVQKTENEKIFIARPETVDMPELERILNELQTCLDDNGDMIACLRKLVPTYHDPDEVNGAAAAVHASAAV